MRVTFPQVKERRIALTGGSLVAFLGFAHLIVDAVTSMFSALLPTLQQSYGLAESTLALLVGALAFSTSFTQPLFGALADRLGRRTVAALGMILSSVLLSLVPIAPNVYLLAGLLLAGGLGSAALHPSGATIARLGGGNRKELAVSIFGMGGTLGVALGPVIVLLVLSRTGTEFAPWLMLPGIVVGLLMLYVVPAREQETRAVVRSQFWDAGLFLGPVGLLALAATLGALASVTFIGAMPLWLVQVRGLEYNSALIGWTLASFSLAAALGGIVAGALSTRLSPRWLVAAAMIMAPLPLLMMLRLEIGTAPYFLAVTAAGALIHAGAPVLVVSAQDMAPKAVATASGMLMGFAAGTAGLLYIGIGHLQELIGLGPAMSFTFLLPIPGAILAFYVLGRAKRSPVQNKATAAKARAMCLCAPCVVGSVTTDLPIQTP